LSDDRDADLKVCDLLPKTFSGCCGNSQAIFLAGRIPANQFGEARGIFCFFFLVEKYCTIYIISHFSEPPLSKK
jgi:hypothetical protein